MKIFLTSQVFTQPSRQLLGGLVIGVSLTLLAIPEAKAADFRTIDGIDNNLSNQDWGSSHTQLLRLTHPSYQDGISEPRGGGINAALQLPSPRAVSNAVSGQSGSVFNSLGASDFLWQWGQFVDHDIDITEGGDTPEAFNILVPSGDPFFDPHNTGTQEIGLNRSIYNPLTGTGTDNPRQQINEITAFIDASNVYGSDLTTAASLRSGVGGKLKTSIGNLLPLSDSNFFLAGDVRANEQVGLIAMHTLFVREHNRLAQEIATADPGLTDEEIYQQARAIVGAQMQVITYNEFLPLLLGEGLGSYAGYKDDVNPGISNEFSTAAYRVGHTMLSPNLLRLDENGNPIPEGNIALRDAFFSPHRVINEGGIDPILRGLATQQAQEVDTLVIDDVRNFLFGVPGSGGFDLASLNIQRGRDHGLPSYNEARIALGLGAARSFADLTRDAELQNAFAGVYNDINDVDFWIGGLAEKHTNGGIVGELFATVIKDQFTRLRDGDRFWYTNVFSGERLQELEDTTLAEVIRRNTDIENIQDNVFLASEKVPEPASVMALLALAAILITKKRNLKTNN
ncbi:MAG: peroxidase family protein [Spirulinaceae cyanobacterium]